MRATLRQVDLSELFLAPDAGGGAALDGFFGATPQRVSLAILQAHRDSLQPERMCIAGKARIQQQVTSFTGDIRIIRLADYYDQGMLDSQGGDLAADTTGEGSNARAYSASAVFNFVHQGPAPYRLTGQALLDFWLTEDGRVGTMHSPAEGIVLKQAPTKGSGLLLRGAWQAAPAGQPRSFVVSRDIFLLSKDLIKDFGIGDRGSEVNPKYAKLGWNTYWQNEEWWDEALAPLP